MISTLVGVTTLCVGSAAASELETFDLASPRVDTAVPGGTLPGGRTVPKVNVLLPDGYDPDSKRGYPVLWLLHGANGGTDSWVGAHNNIEKLAAGIPAIVVMPDGGVFGMYTDWWNGGARGGPGWATYHLKVVRRTIERRYPIRTGRRWHAIGGISMGGQGTLRYAAMLPGYFGSAVGFSAAAPDMQSEVAQLGVAVLPAAGGAEGVTYDSIWGPPTGTYAEGNNPQALVPNYGHTRLYLTSGNGVNCPGDPPTATYALDIVTEAGLNSLQPPFAAAARAAGADVTDVTTCGVHTFGVWDRAFPAAREWGFFKPVPERPRSWTYRTIATSGEMWGLRFRFAEPPSTIAQFERDGRVLQAQGAGSVALRGPRGCRLAEDLPFERRLSRACIR
jgi:S-formylglutathione hydrolase FrmB